ncbi:MAG: hypothetical protein HY924_01960 [Elusimicrobia bacterium]|nr:hypothetical protein [Elusimicrobiota bacterium]
MKTSGTAMAWLLASSLLAGGPALAAAPKSRAQAKAQAPAVVPAAPASLPAPLEPPRAQARGRVVSAAMLEPLMQLVFKKGDDDFTLKGGIAAVLGVPDPTKTRTEMLSARKTTDGWRHLCSVTLHAPSGGGRPVPGELVFWANRKVGRGSEDFYARVSFDGKLLKAIVREDKADEKGYVIRGAGQPMALEIRSQEAQERVRRELELWLYGSGLKPKHGKKHLERLGAFAKAAPKPAPPAEQEEEGAEEEGQPAAEDEPEPAEVQDED